MPYHPYEPEPPLFIRLLAGMALLGLSVYVLGTIVWGVLVETWRWVAGLFGG